MLFDYIDRQVIVSLFPYLKAEWALSDKQLGAAGLGGVGHGGAGRAAGGAARRPRTAA